MAEQGLRRAAMDGFAILYALATALAIVVAALACLQAFEHLRYVRGRLAAPLCHYQARTMVLAPVKGLEPDLEANLRPLFQQEFGPYELVFLVESSLDPGFATVRRLILEYPQVHARLMLTGSAGDCGQKVHNLLVGTAALGDAEVLAFVDSDARVHRQWLAALTSRVGSGFAGAATGYRWYIPTRNTLPNWIACSLNASLVPWMGPGRRPFVWGGSWAISRQVFERIDLRGAWQQTLSDDLVASKALSRAGERVVFEPAAMVGTRADFDWHGLVSFMRRQLIIARCYSRGAWMALAATSLLLAIGLWSNLLLGSVRTIAGGPAGPPLAVAAALYTLHALRAYCRQQAARRYLPQAAEQTRAARWFDQLAGPLTAVALAAAFAAAALGRRITWRCIRYRIGGAGKVAIEYRPDASLQTPKDRFNGAQDRKAA